MNATDGAAGVADELNARVAELNALRDQRRSLEAVRTEAAKDMAGRTPMLLALIVGGIGVLAFYVTDALIGVLAFAVAAVLLVIALTTKSSDPAVREAQTQIVELSKVEQRILELEAQQQAAIKANLDTVELQKTCSRCGTVWHVSPRTARNLKGQNATALFIGLVGGDYAQTAGNQQKASEALRSLQTCPKYSSGKHEETWVN